MRILLCNPPMIHGNLWGCRAGSRWSHFTQMSNSKPYLPYPFYLGYASAVLKRDTNHDVKLIDSIAQMDSYKKFYDDVKKFNPDVVVQEVHETTFTIDRIIAENLKKLGVKVIWCGPYPSANTDKCIPFVNAVLKGEYEQNLLDAINDIDINNSIIIKNYDYKLTENLDDLPYPDRDDVPLWNYNDYFGKLNGKQIQLWSSRGCPYECKFCLIPPTMYNNSVRQRSTDNVIGEIEHCISKYKPDCFYFDDDTWNLGDKKVLEFCKAVKPLNIKWGVMARADSCSLKAFEKMADAGCVGAKIGVESPDQKVVDWLNKRLDLNTVKTVSKHCKDLGMHVHLTFCVGFDVETGDQRCKLQEFCNEVKPDTIQVSQVHKFDGTNLGGGNIKLFPFEV